MMKIEIDIEVASKIIIEALKEDYISQQRDISRLLGKQEPLRDFEQEDLWAFKEVSDAIEVLLCYYMYRGDANAFIKEHKV